MIRNLLIATVMTSLIAGCGGSKKKDAGDTAAEMAGMDGAQVESEAMSFDPSGSDSGNIPGLYTVNFEYDRASLTQEARRQLASNADWMRSRPAVGIQIEGHCDERGSIEYNLSLGERRAKAVRDYLVSLGIERSRLNIISYGEEKPLVRGDNESAYSKNRRANFVPLPQ